jgi:hypothetical protein
VLKQVTVIDMTKLQVRETVVTLTQNILAPLQNLFTALPLNEANNGNETDQTNEVRRVPFNRSTTENHQIHNILN